MKRTVLSLLSTVGMTGASITALSVGIKKAYTFTITGENNLTILAGVACESGMYSILNYSGSNPVTWTLSGDNVGAFNVKTMSSNQSSVCILQWNDTLLAGESTLTLTATNGTNSTSLVIHLNVVNDLTPYKIDGPETVNLNHGVNSSISFSVAGMVAGGTWDISSLTSADSSLPADFAFSSMSGSATLYVYGTAPMGTYTFSLHYDVAGSIIDTLYITVNITNSKAFTNPQPIIFCDTSGSVSSVHSTSFITDDDSNSAVYLAMANGSSLPNGISLNTSREIVVSRNTAKGEYDVDVIWSKPGYNPTIYPVNIFVDSLYSVSNSCIMNPGQNFTMPFNTTGTKGIWSASSNGTNFIPTISSTYSSIQTLNLICETSNVSSETITVKCGASSLPADTTDSSYDPNSTQITKTLSASLYQYYLSGETAVFGKYGDAGSSVAGWSLSGTSGMDMSGTWDCVTSSGGQVPGITVVPSTDNKSCMINWNGTTYGSSDSGYFIRYKLGNTVAASFNFNLILVSLQAGSTSVAMPKGATSTNYYASSNYTVSTFTIGSGTWTGITSSADGYFTGSINSDGSAKFYTNSSKTPTSSTGTVTVNYRYTSPTSKTYDISFPVNASLLSYSMKGETSVVISQGSIGDSNDYELSTNDQTLSGRWAVFNTGTTNPRSGISVSSVDAKHAHIHVDSSVAVGTYVMDVVWQAQTGPASYTTQAIISSVSVYVGKLSFNANPVKCDLGSNSTVKTTFNNLPDMTNPNITWNVTNTSTNKNFSCSGSKESDSIYDVTVSLPSSLSKSYADENIQVTYNYTSTNSDGSNGKTYAVVGNFTASKYTYNGTSTVQGSGYISMYANDKDSEFTWENICQVDTTDGGDITNGKWVITDDLNWNTISIASQTVSNNTNFLTAHFATPTSLADTYVLNNVHLKFLNKYNAVVYQKDIVVSIQGHMNYTHTTSGYGSRGKLNHFYTYRKVGATQYYHCDYNCDYTPGASVWHNHEYNDINRNADSSNSMHFDHSNGGFNVKFNFDFLDDNTMQLVIYAYNSHTHSWSWDLF